MSEKVYFTEQPQPLLYVSVPTGGADVWLRKNIASTKTEEGEQWEADEVFFHTDLTIENIEANFDFYFDYPPAVRQYSDRERIASLESAVRDLAAMIAKGGV